MTSKPPLLVALLLLLAVPGWGPAASAEATELDPRIRVSAEGGSGARVYHAANSAGFGSVQFRVNFTATGDYAPWHMEWITPNGTILPFVASMAAEPDDEPHWGLGDGVAYAGGPAASLATPPLVTDPVEGSWLRRVSIPGDAGWLVLAWANHQHPIDLEVDFPDGTRVTLVASTGAVAGYVAKDFEGGFRAGAPAAAIAHLGDHLPFDPEGGQLWGYVFWTKSTAAGRGNLTLSRAGDGLHRVESFDRDPIATGETCVCSDWGRWLFTSQSDLQVSFDYVGDGTRTVVFVVVAHLPANALPPNLWTEYGGGLRPPGQ